MRVPYAEAHSLPGDPTVSPTTDKARLTFAMLEVNVILFPAYGTKDDPAPTVTPKYGETISDIHGTKSRVI